MMVVMMMTSYDDNDYYDSAVLMAKQISICQWEGVRLHWGSLVEDDPVTSDQKYWSGDRFL